MGINTIQNIVYIKTLKMCFIKPKKLIDKKLVKKCIPTSTNTSTTICLYFSLNFGFINVY